MIDMKVSSRFLLASSAILALAGAANAQLSLGGGVYMPSDSKVRAIFGNNSAAFGFGFGPADRVGRKGLSFDVAGLGLRAPSNNFNMIGGTVGYEVQQSLGDNALGFARAGTGLGYYNYSIAPFGTVIESGNKFAGLTAAEVGVVFNRSTTLSAQYLWMPSVGGYDFSGLRLQLAFTFK